MRMRKGQVTLFVLLGIVVLVILAMLFYLKNADSATKVKRSIEDIGTLFEKQGKYHRYVVECVDQGLKEGVHLVGMQGGAIYDHQAQQGKRFLGPSNGYPYGRYVLPFSTGDSAYNVSYGIYSPELGSDFHPDIPFYPYGLTRLVPNPRAINPFFVNAFGNFPISPLIPLCDYHGKNSRDYSAAAACENYDSRNEAVHNSIQEYLQAYVQNYTKECVKLEELPELSGLEIEIGNVTSEVTFGEKHIFTDVELPIIIELENTRSVLRLKDFHAKVEVRLKKIYELVYHLIQEDINNVYFNIVRDAGSLDDCKDISGGNKGCLKEGMKVYKLRDVCLGSGLCSEGEYDDILVVRDNESYLMGRPYEFHIAIENRPPALDLIRKTKGTGAYHFDYVLPIGGNITIEPIGIDPDEDQHNHLGFMDNIYHYYDWLETYDEHYDASCSKPLHSPDCQSRLSVTPRKWTGSGLYAKTARSAEYKTDANDLGVHTVRAEVCDNEGLCDYQAIMIFVVDGAFAGGFNDYDDIPEGYTSIEDPYVFVSPSGSFIGVPDPDYRWSLFLDTVLQWEHISPEANYSVPSAYDIDDIKAELLPVIPSIGDYTYTLDILNPDGTVALAGTVDNDLTVTECVPHRDTSPPYPYHTTSDPFQADHACCIGDPGDPSEPEWGTIAGTTEKCYSYVEWGCRDDPNYREFPEFTGSIDYVEPPGPEKENDIYRREFSRQCDGNRGNVCLGAMADIRTRITECNDCENCAYSSAGEPSCTDIAPYTVICNADWRCTKGDGEPYDEFGQYTCQATCVEGECNTATNCSCNRDCGAECEYADKQGYVWTGTNCEFDCNGWLTGIGTDCTYHSSDTTICPAPDVPSDCSLMDIDGHSVQVCDPGSGAANTVEQTPERYFIYCRSGDFCYYAVTCSGEGTFELQGDMCLDAGDSADGLCFYDIDGESECLPDGACENADNWSVGCDTGSPELGYCSIGDVCYNSISCNALSGWESAVDDCSPHSCSSGHYLEGDICNYNVACTISGWEVDAIPCTPGKMLGTTCQYTRSCEDSGCLYSDSEYCPAEGTVYGGRCITSSSCTGTGCLTSGDLTPGCPVGKSPECTATGWVCS